MAKISVEELLNEQVNPLSKTYLNDVGVAMSDYVESIFKITYFGNCIGCNFCNDECCKEGCFAEPKILSQINKEKKGLAQFLKISEENWFEEELRTVPEISNITFAQTTVKDGQCVFHNNSSKGCGIHSYALANNRDYHEIKPFRCALFPLLIWEGILQPNLHIDRYQTLSCLENTTSLYRGIRDEILYYFGEEAVAELDAVEERVLGGVEEGSIGLN